MTTEEKKEMKFTISQWRALKGMSKRQLSSASGVTEKTIYNYELSQKFIQNANYQTLNKLAIALGIQVDNIFLGDDSEKPKF